MSMQAEKRDGQFDEKQERMGFEVNFSSDSDARDSNFI